MIIVTVFRSRLRAGIEVEYEEVASEMSRLVISMDGFVDERSYISSDGERVTIVRFVSRESQRSWAEHPDHRRAQRRGVDEFYSWYDISVSEKIYASSFQDPAPQVPSSTV